MKSITKSITEPTIELVADNMLKNAHKTRGFFRRLCFNKTKELIGALNVYYFALVASVKMPNALKSQYFDAVASVKIPNALYSHSIVDKFLNVGEELLTQQISVYQLESSQLLVEMVRDLLRMELLLQHQHPDIQNCAFNKYTARFDTLYGSMNRLLWTLRGLNPNLF